MKISIITPVYNTEKTIERTILSVINQKLDSELEYIIIDGGSKDKTLEIIQRYADKINIIVSEKDKGIYDAMNKGISLATGDVIGIINADDWYNESALGIVEKIFLENPDIAILHSAMKNYLYDKHISTFSPGKLENLTFKMLLAHPTCFVSKSVYKQLGKFDLSYPMAADYDLMLRAYNSGLVFHFVDTPLASFSLNGTTGKVINKLKLLLETWRVGSKYVRKSSSNLAVQHNLFYFQWFCRELATLPLKYFDPLIAIKIKGFLRNKIGKLSSDQYGAW